MIDAHDVVPHGRRHEAGVREPGRRSARAGRGRSAGWLVGGLRASARGQDTTPATLPRNQEGALQPSHRSAARHADPAGIRGSSPAVGDEARAENVARAARTPDAAEAALGAVPRRISLPHGGGCVVAEPVAEVAGPFAAARLPADCGGFEHAHDEPKNGGWKAKIVRATGADGRGARLFSSARTAAQPLSRAS